jgi:hemin uptake protein HemP
MDDKRRYKRFLIKGMNVKCRMHVATDVRLINVSLSGASIRLDRRLNMGSRYRLHIEGGNSKIILNSFVIWEKMVASERNERGDMIPIYEVGIKFDEVISDKGTKLINFIENNIKQTEFKTRLRGLRVDILTPEKTVITDHLGNYYVMKISQSGLLIETDQKLDVESKITMELNLPESKKSIKFLGRIASCLEHQDKTTKGFETGIEFLEISENDRSKIREFLESIH